MEAIPLTTVEKIWNDVADIQDEESFQKLVKDMEAKQPFVLTYLLASGENFLKDDEIGELIILGAVAWLSFEAQSPNFNIVPASLLEAESAKAFNALENNTTEVESDAVDFVLGARQRALLESLLGYLLETENNIHPDRQGIAFILLKVAVESMDQMETLPS